METDLMIQEEGIVKEVRGDRALVLTERKGDCAHCSARHSCLIQDDGKETLAQVLNPVGASEGDRVRITIQDGILLRNSLFLYFIPAVV